MTHVLSLRAWLCTALLCAISNASAQTAPPASPSQIQEDPATLILSDKLRYDDIKRLSVFSGSVIMTRGLMTLHADNLDVQEDAEGFQHAVATANKGKLVYVRQNRPESFEIIEAKGTRVEYDSKAERIDIIGLAVVTRFICGKPFDSVSGQRVRYHQKTDTYEAFGDSDSAAPGGRVRSLAMPRARANAAIAACSKEQNSQAETPAQ